MKINKEKIHFFLHIILVILLILNKTVDSSIYSVLVLIYAICLTLISSPEYLLVSCILTDSIQGYFLITPTLSFSRILSLLYIGGMFWRRKVRLKSNITTVFFVVFGLYHVLTSFWAITDSFKEAVSFFIGIIMIIFMMGDNNFHIENMRKLLCFTSYIFISVIFLSTVTMGGIHGSQIVFDEELNANTICSAIALFAIVIHTNFLNKMDKKLWDYIFLGISILTILIVGSRTSLISLILCMVVCTLILNKQKGFNWKKIVTFIVIIVGLYFLIVYIMTINPEVAERFTFQGSSMKSADRRFLVWEALIQHVIPQNLLLGVGYGLANVRESVRPYVQYAFHAHNMYLAILAETGLVGVSMYVVLFKNIIKKLRANNRKTVNILWGMFLLALMLGMGEEMINRKWLWLTIGLIFMFSNKNSIRGEKKEFILSNDRRF